MPFACFANSSSNGRIGTVRFLAEFPIFLAIRMGAVPVLVIFLQVPANLASVKKPEDAIYNMFPMA